MADYSWPKYGTAAVLGTSHLRIDGLPKATGAAKYAYDINPPGVLIARGLSCPHPRAMIVAIDLGPATKVPGVVAVKALKKAGDEIRAEGDLVACVAAETEGAAAEGMNAIRVVYEPLPFFVNDQDLAAATLAERTVSGGENVQLESEPAEDVEDEEAWENSEFERLFGEAACVIEADYGIEAITHMCLEPHGSTCEWTDGKLTAHLSTQNVSGTAAQFAEPLGITADEVTIHCDYIGGGFGSKFAADIWGVAAAELSRETGRPVKWMLDRQQELKIAGCRPSGFIHVKVGADKEGVVKVWDSHHWGTSGPKAGGVSQDYVPYVFDPPNRRRKQTSIITDTGPDRAWRAPNHPQACAITQTAFDDIARSLGIDSFDVFLRNLPSVSNDKADVYREQMEIAAKMIGWKDHWHPHGQGEARGSIVDGLGMAIHTWGGGAHNSTCLVRVHPDGGVEVNLGSQDIGTGTRTVIAMVAAETFGLPVEAIKVNLGSSRYPVSGPSGGSTTVGGVSESTRRGTQDALEKIVALVAKKLKVKPADLEAREGRIQVASGNKGLSWKDACGLLGMQPLEVQGNFTRGEEESPLSSSKVAGVQMAHVEVDRDTGVVRMKKFVAVQDMGLIVNRQTALSQIYGAVIMGIAYALFEERIMDRYSGAFVNSELADYRLPRLGDIGEIAIELYEPESEYQRGVVGLGEPPVISPGAAISNAVCNALGVRVPVLPMTPKRVLDAIASAQG